MECIFCKIATGKIPAKIVYEDDKVIAFDDLNPQAPIHKLIITRKHIATLNEMTDSEINLIGHMLLTAKKLAAELKIADQGYRTIFNCNKAGGQEVFHLHLHLLGGRQMQWPPG